MFVRLLCFLGLVMVASAFSDCGGVPNDNKILTGEPTLVKTVVNGSLYTFPQTDPPLLIAHVYGDPYSMGFATGQLVSKQIHGLYSEFYEYIEQTIEPYVGFLPQEMQDLLAINGSQALLELTAKWTEPFTPQHFFDEMHGLADGSGIAYQDILNIAMFPELIKASCSMFGAWGDATKDVDSTLVVLRALDWGTDGPFQQFPLLTVYHPDADNGHEFAQLGWTGLTGAITGYSPKMAICEKVWDAYNGTSVRKGYPWTFLFRDILQYDEDTAAAEKRVDDATRTCSVFLGLGDHSTETFEVIEYCHESADVYNVSYPDHTYWPTLPFVNKHVQPSSEACMNDLLTNYYGSITPETTIQYIAAQEATGDMHAAVYDYARDLMFISNASPAKNGTDGDPAYTRPFAQVNMTKMWAEKRPTKLVNIMY